MFCVVLLGVVFAGATDSQEISNASVGLESYLTSIQSQDMRYREQSEYSETPEGKAVVEAQLEKLPPSERKKAKESYQKGLREKATKSYDLLFAYPSSRLRIVDNENAAERIYESYVHDGRSVSIDHKNKQVHIQSKSSPRSIEHLPTDAIGLRALHTTNKPVSEYFKLTDCVHFEGEEEIGGVTAKVFKIGPSIPQASRPVTWEDSSFLKLWLAPDLSYAPVRIEYSVKFKSFDHTLQFVYEAGQYEATTDNSRNTMIQFPRVLSFETEGMRREWTISDVRLNIDPPANEFVAQIPAGYTVFQDGNLQSMTGGTKAYDASINEAAESALVALQKAPRAAHRFGYLWYLAIIGGMAGLTGFGLFYALHFLKTWQTLYGEFH